MRTIQSPCCIPRHRKQILEEGARKQGRLAGRSDIVSVDTMSCPSGHVFGNGSWWRGRGNALCAFLGIGLCFEHIRQHSHAAANRSAAGVVARSAAEVVLRVKGQLDAYGAVGERAHAA